MNRPVRKNQDLHGNAPDSCPVVFLLVDVLNDVDFPGNSRLLKSIASLGKNISALKKRCKDAGKAQAFGFLGHAARYAFFLPKS
jgi:hypothetical protein